MTGLQMRPCSSASDAASFMESSDIDEIADRLVVLHHQESTSYRRIDYLSSISKDTNNGITLSNVFQAQHQNARSKMLNWCHQIIDMCQLSRLSTARAMNYLDQFMASSHQIARQALFDRRKYQLASMTCLYIAIKLYEPMSMDASLLAAVSAGTYETFEILDMERSIIDALEWKMNGPTSQEFLCLLLGLLNPRWYNYDVETIGSVLDVSMFQCELASGDYDLSLNCKPSVIALASILNSLDGTDEALLSSKVKYSFLTKACPMIMPRSVDMEHVYVVQEKVRRLLCQNSGISIGFNGNEETQELASSENTPGPTKSERSELIETTAASSFDKLTSSSSPVSVATGSCPQRVRQSFAKCA